MTDQTEMQARIEALEAERDRLREALRDLYEVAFAIRLHSSKPYKFSALDKAEAKARAALKGEGE